MVKVGTFADGSSGSGLGPDEAGALVGAFAQSTATAAFALLLLALTLTVALLARSGPLPRVAPGRARTELLGARLHVALAPKAHRAPGTSAQGGYERRFHSRAPLTRTKNNRENTLDLRYLAAKSNESLERGPP